MVDPIASPGDPIFYLHHTWLDRLFWQWQSLSLPARFSDVGGGNVQTGFGFGPPPTAGDEQGPPVVSPLIGGWFPPGDSMRPPPGSPPQIPAGDPGSLTTLTHILNMFGVIPNATIADVMDIGGPLLCFEYV